MKIGIAGPVSLRLLKGLGSESGLPVGYEHPPMSALVNALLECGHEVTVFTTSTGLDAPAVFGAANLNVCVARREPRAARDLFRSEREDLVKLMKSYTPDILNAHWSYEFAWAALDSGIPTVVTLRDHALTVLKYRINSYKLLRLFMNYYVINRAKYLSTNSDYLFQRLSLRHRQKARVIRNFFPSELSALRHAYNGRDDIVISVANGFGRLKNIQSAMRAFKIVRQTIPSAKYIIVGHGMEPGGAAESYAKKENLADGIMFAGRLAHGQVLELLRKAKLLLHPSLEESFGMSVLEAMVIGTPVVAGAKSGNIPYLLDEGRAGILCDVRDSQGMARRVIEMMLNEAKAGELAKRGTEYAEMNYAQETVVSDYVGYFRDIVHEHAE